VVLADVLDRIDGVLARANLTPGQRVVLGQFGGVPGMHDGEVTGVTTAMLAVIDRLTLPGSPYREIAAKEVANRGAFAGQRLAALAGILNGLRADYEAGYLGTVAELIHADVFGDFLEMADELMAKGYKDAAAVLGGSVLEEHIRKLCDKAGIPVSDKNGKPKKADLLNADLAKANVYNKLEQKSVTAWLGLRNDAAHGHYDSYTAEQVALMVSSIRDFMIRRPA
jgi:hypothetical protein